MQLQFMQHIQLANTIDTIISLVTAFVLGGLIGFERQYRQRTAGLRTNVLVAVGAAIFVDIANNLSGADGAVRVIAYVVSGIGFLGAGVIGISALWTVATLAKPIVQAIRNQPARRVAEGGGGDETDKDMPRSWMLMIGAAALGVLFLVVNDFIAGHMPDLAAGARYGLAALCVLFAALFGFLVAAACGYMAGLVGSSASPISGIGIIATLLMGVSLLALQIGRAHV